MVLKILLITIFLLLYVIYKLYFNKYHKVKRIFETLSNFLNVRDALVLKIISEINDKKVSEKIFNLINERKENFKTSYNNSIIADAKLNKELRNFYEILNKIKKNEIVNSAFAKIINIEKDLKNIRNEYNNAVEEYNQNLIKHKFICLKVIKMKPLDTYKKS